MGAGGAGSQITYHRSVANNQIIIVDTFLYMEIIGVFGRFSVENSKKTFIR